MLWRTGLGRWRFALQLDENQLERLIAQVFGRMFAGRCVASVTCLECLLVGFSARQSEPDVPIAQEDRDAVRMVVHG